MWLTINEADQLNNWYKNNKRSLPWRDTGNPYDVWISEIMLQQTRIEAVIPKYLLFKKELPDIKTLADCSEDHLMRLWEGLGYYSRAKNLRKCAIVLMHSYGGLLPDSYEDLIQLPGIGPYTAGAIVSIAFGKAVPAIDGNVMRVITRRFAIKEDVRSEKTKEEVKSTLQKIYSSHQRPAFYQAFNQALMELGEVLCASNGIPLCNQCPWNRQCICCQKGLWQDIPYRSPLKQRKVIERTILVIHCNDIFLIHKRPEKGLLAGLYEFKGIDTYLNENEAARTAEQMGLRPLHIQRLPDTVHIFTHLEWHMKAYDIQVQNLDQINDPEYLVLHKRELQDYAIPSAFQKYVQLYAIRPHAKK